MDKLLSYFVNAITCHMFFLNLYSVFTLDEIFHLLPKSHREKYKISFGKQLSLIIDHKTQHCFQMHRNANPNLQSVLGDVCLCFQERMVLSKGCIHQQNTIKYNLARTLCFPAPRAQGLVSMTFSTGIIERTEFHVNISFIYFHLSSHVDFVFLNFSEKNYYFKLTYTFCGVRHPWTVHYPKHKTHLQVSLTRSSNFYMTFQVENRELVGDFHHCAYDDPCRKGSNCGNRRFQQQYERLLRGHDWIHFSHWIEIQVVEFLFIFNVAVKKYQLLKIMLKHTANIEVHIFDGPWTDIIFLHTVPLRESWLWVKPLAEANLCLQIVIGGET